MGRTLQEIKLQITENFVENETVKELYGLTDGKTFEDEFSLVSFENVLFDIISYAIYLLELLFNQHNTEIDEKLKDQKRGRLSWYKYMALKYQHGYSLINDTDEFDNTNANLEDIELSKIIKNASVADGDIPGVIVIKVAGEENGDLAPVPDDSVLGIETYFKEIRFAGNRIAIVNYLPDLLYLNYDIYIDPLVLDQYGVNSKTGTKPVEEAIEAFKRSFSFDGELILEDLDDAIQSVEGVEIAHRKLVTSSFIVAELNDYAEPIEIEVKKVLVSGYFATPNFDGISYVV